MFARRTEIKSSVDRYANLEVNFLLQKTEEFDGLAILTTNLRGSIDEAFLRRVRFRVHFPAPDEDERARLWRALLPRGAALARTLDVTDVAARYELAGGHIRNAVLRAAHLAAAEGVPDRDGAPRARRAAGVRGARESRPCVRRERSRTSGPAPTSARPRRRWHGTRTSPPPSTPPSPRCTCRRPRSPPRPEDLVQVEGKPVRVDVAPRVEALLAALRRDLDTARAHDDGARRVSRIRINSAYRDPVHDFSLWDGQFQQYLAETAGSRARCAGGPYGPEATKLVVEAMRDFKAPPGFSKHTGGTAVDLDALVDGEWLGCKSRHQARWRRSWVFAWLAAHAPALGFRGLPSEAWHWELHE